MVTVFQKLSGIITRSFVDLTPASEHRCRPVHIHPDAQEENNISAKISVAELTGAEFMLYTTVGGHELVVRAGALNDYHAGENITIHFDMTKCHFFDAETEIAIR